MLSCVLKRNELTPSKLAASGLQEILHYGENVTLHANLSPSLPLYPSHTHSLRIYTSPSNPTPGPPRLIDPSVHHYQKTAIFVEAKERRRDRQCLNSNEKNETSSILGEEILKNTLLMIVLRWP